MLTIDHELQLNYQPGRSRDDNNCQRKVMHLRAEATDNAENDKNNPEVADPIHQRDYVLLATPVE